MTENEIGLKVLTNFSLYLHSHDKKQFDLWIILLFRPGNIVLQLSIQL